MTVTSASGATVTYLTDGTTYSSYLPTYKDVGTYTICYKITGSDIDTIYGSATVSIGQAEPTISLNDVSKTYDGTAVSDPTVSVTLAGSDTYSGAPSITYYSVADDGTETGLSSAPSAAGRYKVVVSVSGEGDNYTSATASAYFTIGKAALTVTAGNDSISYNDAAPTHTAEYSGFVNSETESVLIGTLAFDCDYSPGNAVGTYDITPSGLSSDNYTITYTSGTLTVTALSIADATAAVSGTYNYTGQARTPSLTVTLDDDTLTEGTDYTVTYADSEGDVVDSDELVNAGTYTVTVTGKGNYTGMVSTQFTIDKADPEYTAPTDLTATCGQTLADVTLTDGWAWADSSAGVGDVGTNAFPATYTPDDTANYNTVTVDLDVTVSAIALTESMFTVDTEDETYTGGAIEKAISSDLTEGTDYTVTYEDSEGNTVDSDAPVEAGTYTIVIAGTGNYSGTLEYTFTIKKAEPDYTTPTDLTATYGQTLADIALPDGWTWEDSSLSVGDVGENIFTAIFTPSNTDNYETVTVEVTVTVSEGTTWYSITVSDTENGTVSVSPTTATAGTTVTITAEPYDGYAISTLVATDADETEIELAYDEETNTYSFTMPAGAVTVTAAFAEIVETHVVVAATEGSVSDGIAEELVEAATGVAESVSMDTEDLAQVVEDVKDSIAESHGLDADTVLEILAENNIEVGDEDTARIVIETYLSTSVESLTISEDGTKELSVEITLLYNLYLTTGNPEDVAEDADNTVLLEKAQKVTMDSWDPMELSVNVTGMEYGSEDAVYVRHDSSYGVYYYKAALNTDDEGQTIATFTNRHGYSLFTFVVSNDSPAVYYSDLNQEETYTQDQVNEVSLPDAPEKTGYTFAGWSFEGLDGTYTTLTEELFDFLSDAGATVTATAVYTKDSAATDTGDSDSDGDGETSGGSTDDGTTSGSGSSSGGTSSDSGSSADDSSGSGSSSTGDSSDTTSTTATSSATSSADTGDTNPVLPLAGACAAALVLIAALLAVRRRKHL
ncbi:MAG: LPXTG cell wall anchor domain-containing protein [Clostridiales bacterium]|nr:LPXTG cell wall anchor domain-containing protein [Clostridiales bacterium]